MNRKVTIILPTKNEEECIGEILRRVGSEYKVIVVDDSTNILTYEAAIKAAKSYNIDLLFLHGEGNESPSVRKALEKSKTDWNVIMDSDGNHSEKIISEMIDFKYDLCVGSRYCFGGSVGESNYLSSLGNKFSRLFLGLKTNELTSRFLAGRKDLLLKASKWDGRGENSIDVVNYCERRKLRIKEVPFTQSERIGGESKTVIRKYIKTYLGKVFKLKLDRYRLFSKNFISRALSNDWMGEKKPKMSFMTGVIDILQFPVCMFGVFICKIPLLSNVLEIVSRIWGKSRIGFLLRGIYYKSKLGFMGIDVFIDQGVTILNPEKVFIDDECLIDQDTQLICGEGEIKIGKHVHIGSCCYINGKPLVEIGDYTCIDHQCQVFGATNEYSKDGKRYSMSCVAPYELQYITKKGVKVGKMAFLGPNSVLVCANIGDYSIIGANSFVKEDIRSNVVAAGSPAKEKIQL